VAVVACSCFESPFGGRYYRETMPEIERAYIRTGKIRYVFRNFPLEAIHHEAFKAAEAAMCAGEQDKFWEMHDHLFAHQDALAATDLPGHAAAVGLDLPRFERCLAGGTYAEDIRRDLAEGQKAGVRGTPSFFLGVAGSDGRRPTPPPSCPTRPAKEGRLAASPRRAGGPAQRAGSGSPRVPDSPRTRLLAARPTADSSRTEPGRGDGRPAIVLNSGVGLWW